MRRGLAALALFFAASAAADAAQQLIPAPYPESFGNTAILPEGAPRASRHQHLKPDPVPQSLGPNALGNPQTGGVRKHQKLIPTPYWRQYHQFPR
ncbi:hypothetical protein [Methylocella silvestris]|uniref:hypothetical protein n=1 Tax=Methylocella silvestris TaxID=199596 RepID=UPI0011AFACCC|nr:hypothetical protein [Methylocella silvestris]